jgi:hypothetical protein
MDINDECPRMLAISQYQTTPQLFLFVKCLCNRLYGEVRGILPKFRELKAITTRHSCSRAAYRRYPEPNNNSEEKKQLLRNVAKVVVVRKKPRLWQPPQSLRLYMIPNIRIMNQEHPRL